MDVTSDEDVKDVVQHIINVEGRIDVVVNNAGIMCAGGNRQAYLWLPLLTETGPMIDQSIDYVKRVFDTNTFAALRMAKAVIPPMAERRTGVIVNIGSVVGEL